jgi:hypothetical protein
MPSVIMLGVAFNLLYSEFRYAVYRMLSVIMLCVAFHLLLF